MNVRHCSYLLVSIIFGHISNLRIWIAKSEFFGKFSTDFTVPEMWAHSADYYSWTDRFQSCL
jgi:hypothetical protein